MNSNTATNNRVQLMLPINIITAFLFLTVFLFFWGPVQYEFHYKLLDFLYLISAIVLFRVGYIRGIKTHGKENSFVNYSDLEENGVFSRKKRKRFYIILLVYVAVALLTLTSKTGNSSLDFSAFNNLGAAYYARGNSNLLYERILIFASPITLMFIPYGMMNWKHLNMLQRIAFIGAVAFRVLVDLVQGINKSFADAIIFVCIYVILVFAKPTIFQKDGQRRFRRRIVFIAFLLGILFAIFLAYFSMNLLSRTIYEENAYNNGLMYLVRYITEGYQAVDYSLTQPFDSTFGLGNSLYLLDIIPQYFKTDFFLCRSYVFKNQITYGWSYLVNWSSLYVWIGNDFSMLGVLPIMFVIGRLFGRTWKDALLNPTDLSTIIVVGLLFQLAIYIPANNQIVQIQTAFFSTWFWLIYWFLHKKVRIRIHR